MKKKKVLIISMSGGFGHISAGNALLAYARENLSNVNAKHVDISDINVSLKKYSKIYDVISKKYPFVWKFIYTHEFIFSVAKKITFLKGLFEQKAKQYIYKEEPDIVIFTNVEILPLFAFSLRKKFPNIKIGIVVTDYHGHSYYNVFDVDYYFVPTLHVQKELQEEGVSAEKIVVTGIPINPKFYTKENNKALKIKYGIKNNLPVLLFIASFRATKTDVLSVVGQLLELEPKINLVFIANGNEEFYAGAKEKFENHGRFLLVKWTNVIEEYMKLSSVVISKAGGLTVSECISLKKPLVMVNPIPGQEEHNARFVQENSLGVRVNNINEIITVVPKILFSKKAQKNTLVPQNPCEKIFSAIL